MKFTRYQGYFQIKQIVQILEKQMANIIMIILQQINYNFPMTSSYNLRHRQKESSPCSKKQLSRSLNDHQITTPKTQHKMTAHKQLQEKSPKKLVSNSGSSSSSVLELHTNLGINNESFNVQPTSNSQLDSTVNLRKNKIEQIVIGRQEDNAESLIYDQSLLYKSFVFQKGIKRYNSSIQIGIDKKQYKNIRHPIPLGIPYRKFQTQLQQKVVCILNKITQQRVCIKQIEKLFKKISNLSAKDLRNRYFISGITVLVRLITTSELSKSYQPESLQKIEQAYKALRQKILDELDNIQEFKNNQVHQAQTVDSAKLIRRVYKIFRKKFRLESRGDLQNKSINKVKEYTQSSGGIDVKLLFKSICQV